MRHRNKIQNIMNPHQSMKTDQAGPCWKSFKVMDLNFKPTENESGSMIRAGLTLQEILNQFDNDYSPQRGYREKVGAELLEIRTKQ